MRDPFPPSCNVYIPFFFFFILFLSLFLFVHNIILTLYFVCFHSLSYILFLFLHLFVYLLNLIFFFCLFFEHTFFIGSFYFCCFWFVNVSSLLLDLFLFNLFYSVFFQPSLSSLSLPHFCQCHRDRYGWRTSDWTVQKFKKKNVSKKPSQEKIFAGKML